jgi:hypothetical protein
MQRFEVWTAGSKQENNRSGPVFHGAVYADTFTEACEKLTKDNVWFADSVAGMQLFESETDARASIA